MKHTGRLLLAVWLGTLACTERESEIAPVSPGSDGPLVVYAVNEPLRYFAERIGGDEVRAVLPAPPGVDPADWSPDGDTVAEYQQADLILRNGAGYAVWVARASLPRATQVDTTADFRDRTLPAPTEPTHRHGPQGADTHDATATATWLDPTLAAQQARTIATALARARPTQAAQFETRLAELEADLEDLDARFERAMGAWPGEPILFSHPVYAYFERRYGVDGRSLHWEPEQVPDAGEWKELGALLESQPARLMIWEAKPREETTRRLRELDIAVVVVPARGDADDHANWLERMRASAARLQEQAR
jgi:zinc transport system substrate-binding protein